MLETKSNKAVLKSLLALGELFFSRQRVLPKIALRLQPLVIGPTGCGKSFIVECAARKLGATYLRLTRGDWIATGSTAGRRTSFQIIDWVASSERSILHLDEADKLSNLHGGSEWSASVGTDLWNILDRKFQVEDYLRETTFAEGQAPTAEQLRLKLQNRLWIVGSGTFQGVFEGSRPGAKIGFSGAARGEAVGASSIAASRVISPELLSRFNSDLLFLDYPTPEETEDLLIFSGIDALAAKLGRPIRAADVDWTQGGMRVLETLATRLAVELFNRERAKPKASRPDAGVSCDGG